MTAMSLSCYQVPMWGCAQQLTKCLGRGPSSVRATSCRHSHWQTDGLLPSTGQVVLDSVQTDAPAITATCCYLWLASSIKRRGAFGPSRCVTYTGSVACLRAGCAVRQVRSRDCMYMPRGTPCAETLAAAGLDSHVAGSCDSRLLCWMVGGKLQLHAHAPAAGYAIR